MGAEGGGLDVRADVTALVTQAGDGEDELRKMQVLFPRLIVTKPERLPGQWVGMVISLA